MDEKDAKQQSEHTTTETVRKLPPRDRQPEHYDPSRREKPKIQTTIDSHEGQIENDQL